MANARRGEVPILLEGKTYTLCLTLGALAELEQAFGDADLLALASRFETGRLSAIDVQTLLVAGLRGGGHDVSANDVGRMRCDGGVAGIVAAVSELLNVTFGGDAAVDEIKQPAQPTASTTVRGDHDASVPFPGTT